MLDRSNYRCVTCDEWVVEPYNGNDFDGDCVPLIIRGSPLNQVRLGENQKDYSPCELQFGDIEGWGAAREVGHYWVNRCVAGEFRDADRTDVCDALGTSAKTYFPRQRRGKNDRSVKKSESHLGKYMGKYKGLRRTRFRIFNRENGFEKRQSARKLATDVGFSESFDYEQMKRVKRRWGEYAWFGCGNTSRFREEFPVCIYKMKRIKANAKCKGKANCSEKRERIMKAKERTKE